MPSSANMIAYVVCDDADCHYAPDQNSPVRITPPYGASVEIHEVSSDWIKISWLGKLGWVASEKLAELEPEPRAAGIDLSRHIFPPVDHSTLRNHRSPQYFETGPRGGRFTRTRSGHRRYF